MWWILFALRAIENRNAIIEISGWQGICRMLRTSRDLPSELVGRFSAGVTRGSIRSCSNLRTDTRFEPGCGFIDPRSIWLLVRAQRQRLACAVGAKVRSRPPSNDGAGIAGDRAGVRRDASLGNVGRSANARSRTALLGG